MERITWADVQEVYPDIPLEELQAQLAAYGYTDVDYSLDTLMFEVITRGCWVEWSNGDQKWVRLDEPTFRPFEKGGILLIMPSGREPFGPGRKSSKWWVDSVECRTLAEAKIISERVKAAPTEGYGDPSDYDMLFEEQK